jgi:hypothetical protein
MTTRIGSVTLIVSLVLAGCSANASPVATPTVAPQATIAVTPAPTPTPTPVPTPSPSPTLSTAELGTMYLACANPYNTRNDKLYAQEKKTTSLATLRSIYRQYAANEGTFDSCVRAIAWPSALAADVHDLLKADATAQVIELEMSVARTFSLFNSYFPALNAATTAGGGAANQLRGDLGLPPPPV